MFLTRSEYDRGVNTFSPQGRLFQLQYAVQAIKIGSTALGICTSEGVILAVEKRIISSLMVPTTMERIFAIDQHIGCVASGLIADARTLIDRARIECQNHWFIYDERMPVESCTQAVSTLAMQFGDSGNPDSLMSRPFGVGILFAGIDNNEPQLWYMDPSGACVRYNAHAIGSDGENACQILQDHYTSEMSLKDAINLSLNTLKQVMREKLDSTNIEIMVMTPDKLFHLCTKDEVHDIITQLI